MFPLVWYANARVTGSEPPEYVKRSRPATPSEADVVMVNPHIQNHVQIAAGVAALVRDKALSPARLAPYAAQFDVSLAEKLAVGQTLTQAEAHNAALIEQLLASELKVRARRDHEAARVILAGSFGSAVRSIRDASFKGFNSEMVVAWTTALTSSLGAMATGGAMTPVQALAAQQQGLNDLASKLDRSGKAFLAATAPSLQKLDNAWVEYAGQRVNLDVTDQQALTSALKRLYDKFRR